MDTTHLPPESSPCAKEKELREKVAFLEEENQKLSHEFQDFRKKVELFMNKMEGTADDGDSSADPGASEGQDREPEKREPPATLTQIPPDLNEQLGKICRDISALQDSEKDQRQLLRDDLEAFRQDMEGKLQDINAIIRRVREDTEAPVTVERKGADEKISKSNVYSVVEKLRNNVKQMTSENKMADEKLDSLETQVRGLDRDLKEGMKTKIKEGLRTGHQAVQKELAHQKTSINQSLLEIRQQLQDLENKIEESNQAVSFHARLASEVTVCDPQTLVCQEVVSNHGLGYDPYTGCFDCPVAGTYCFLATSSPNDPDPSMEAALDLMVDGVAKGGLCANGHQWATAHCVLELNKDERVWLRTQRGKHQYSGDGWTSFTGMLIQATLPDGKKALECLESGHVF